MYIILVNFDKYWYIFVLKLALSMRWGKEKKIEIVRCNSRLMVSSLETIQQCSVGCCNMVSVWRDDGIHQLKFGNNTVWPNSNPKILPCWILPLTKHLWIYITLPLQLSWIGKISKKGSLKALWFTVSLWTINITIKLRNSTNLTMCQRNLREAVEETSRGWDSFKTKKKYQVPQHNKQKAAIWKSRVCAKYNKIKKIPR